MSQQMATHAGRTTCQNRIRNPSSKAEWEVQDPKPLERTKFQNMLGEPNSKTQVPKPKFQNPSSENPKVQNGLPLCYYHWDCYYEALLLPLRLVQLLFCTRLHKHAVSRDWHPQSSRFRNDSTASCTASRRAGVGLTSYRGSPCKVHSLSKRIGADR